MQVSRHQLRHRTRSRRKAPGRVRPGGCAVELEMGDVLFSLVNVARKMGVQAEEALRATCGKFRTRWAFMEGAAAGQGRRVEDLSMEEMEELWQMSKALEG